jgi:hypothetical protein
MHYPITGELPTAVCCAGRPHFATQGQLKCHCLLQKHPTHAFCYPHPLILAAAVS